MKKGNTKDSNLFIHKREKASFHCLLSELLLPFRYLFPKLSFVVQYN